MTRPLVTVAADDVDGLVEAARAALHGGGAAVFPVPPGHRMPGGRLLAPGDVVGEVDDRVAVVVETSGSTEAPKRVALSSEALLASADATHEALGGAGRWVLALPGHYIAGLQVIVRALAAGTEPLDVPGERFDPVAFAAAAAPLRRSHDRAYTSLVPVQLARVLEAAEHDRGVREALARFDRVLLGGQAAPPGLVERAAAMGARVTRTYGSSETAGGCVYDGRPLPGVRLRIVDGQVELAAPSLAEGYLDFPEAPTRPGDEPLLIPVDTARTDAAFATDADGTRWYRTGDLGDLADDGTLRIRGRADDVIVSGGVKVALGEVERTVRALDGFAHAVVVAAPHAEWGAAPAVVAPATGPARATDALERLAAHVASVAGAAARPARLIVVDELPLLDSGKPDRRALAALAAEA
ncbi:O-succinylbenzoic acid--CoA ligase [Agromyces rhizosphaerae]|uniref:O-succinylbenzoic acid--CoA ligase n=1 Tax=Agromyces rhizosphaerae TaxID=88374 RepID=A0A9W6CQW0_9MICO|nr:AMP-binding protein [Agromyces rhizosphaerae]GLI26863.1 O-succinylbenzoic acid--CoA ligase [Agromyces rhizosphaerae]